MPSRQLAVIPHSNRVAEVLSLLCIHAPSLSAVREWLFSEDEYLQEFVIDYSRVGWAMGIGTIDAARILAEQVEEGRPELISEGVERLLRAVMAGEVVVRRVRSSWRLTTPPRRVSDLDLSDALSDNLLAVDGKMLVLTNHFDFSPLK